jgi:hypothetical protein
VTNANEAAWKTHVFVLNYRFNILFAALATVSIGCIPGFPNLRLAGLPNPPLPVVGVPDKA